MFEIKARTWRVNPLLSFKVLGTLDVVNGRRVCGPTAPRALGTLALLVLRANYVVPISSIIEELWGDSPPRSAATTAQTYIYQLRRLIDEEDCPELGKDVLVTKAPGYVLRVDPDAIDLFQFQRLTTDAQAMLACGRPELAAPALRRALDMWSGAPLANVRTGPVLDGYVAALEEERIHALNLRIEADLRLGRLHELIPELQTLVAEHPYNEWYHGLLVFALARVGRRNDALSMYARTRRLLADELGLTPCSELQRMQEAVLKNRELRPPHPMASSTELRVA
jgi:SARP family transcriptional regulator, regulator of embCAB operon